MECESTTATGMSKLEQPIYCSMFDVSKYDHMTTKARFTRYKLGGVE